MIKRAMNDSSKNARAPRLGAPRPRRRASACASRTTRTIFESKPNVDWFEIISENFMVGGGRPMKNLERALERYPRRAARRLALDRQHRPARLGVPAQAQGAGPKRTGIAVGQRPPLLDRRRRREPARPAAAALHRGGGRARRRARARSCRTSSRCRFVLENVSSYLTYTSSAMTEWEFVTRDRRGGRLRPPARREQHLRLVVQPRLRSARLRRRRAAPPRGADPPRRAHQLRQVHPRHPQRSRDRRGVGRSTARAIERMRPRLDAGRVGRRHPAFDELYAEAEKAGAARSRARRARSAGRGDPRLKPEAAVSPRPTPREPAPPASLVQVQAFLSDAFRRPSRVAGDAGAGARLRGARRRQRSPHAGGAGRHLPSPVLAASRRDARARTTPAWRTCSATRRSTPSSAPTSPRTRRRRPTCATWAPRSARSSTSCAELPPASSAAGRARRSATSMAFVDVFDGADPPPLDARSASPRCRPRRGRRPGSCSSPLVVRRRFEHPVHRLRILVRERTSDAPSTRPTTQRSTSTVRLAARSSPTSTHGSRARRDRCTWRSSARSWSFTSRSCRRRRSRCSRRSRAGDSLVAACAQIAEGTSEAETAALAAQMGEWFRRWASWLGFVADVVLEGE